MSFFLAQLVFRNFFRNYFTKYWYSCEFWKGNFLFFLILTFLFITPEPLASQRKIWAISLIKSCWYVKCWHLKGWYIQTSRCQGLTFQMWDVKSWRFKREMSRLDVVTFSTLRINMKGDKCDHVKKGPINPHF